MRLCLSQDFWRLGLLRRGVLLLTLGFFIPMGAQQRSPDYASGLAAAQAQNVAQLAPAPDQPPRQATPVSATESGAPAGAAKPATITGTVTDVQDEVVPDAEVTLTCPDAGDSRQTTANDLGAFQFAGIKPSFACHLAIQAKGFAPWTSEEIVLSPGQYQILPGIQLELSGEAQSVIVSASPAELSQEQVKIAEQQRVFGIVPNFYVAYDRNAPPLTAKSKYQIAIRVSADPITIAGVLFLAGVNQGVRIPDYRLGARGYGERVGSVAADGFTDIFFGGAVLPGLLHQDPRYFYQGTGATHSRLLHALAGPFVCRGDNGRYQPNYSTIGGDVISAGFSNLYYPKEDRTWTFFGENVMISTIERMASTVTQEFVLRHLTSGPKGKGANTDAAP